MKCDKIITTRVPEKLKQKLTLIADGEQRSLSVIVKRILTDHVVQLTGLKQNV